MHGHNNVYGATMFPHNIGLGAARDPKLVGEIGAPPPRRCAPPASPGCSADAGRGARRPLGPHLRELLGRPDAGAEYAGVYVKGMQGNLQGRRNVVATAKHFMGDGGTDQGKDRGVNKSSEREMMNIHAQGYYTALAAGAQTVMASFNSWNDVGPASTTARCTAAASC
jgi:beta-glucosidase